jgi:hypothetical protein
MRALRQRVSRALRPAVDFLVRAQGSDGLWRDFPCFVGPSDEWVTAYVANALLGISTQASEFSIGHACYALQKRQRRAGGWAFNGDSPPDADSTAWTYRLLTALGRSRWECALRARKFMARHQRRDGGIVTYASPQPLKRKFARPSAWPTYSGWCVTDPCVTAASVVTLDPKGQRAARRFLLATQGGRCEWGGYWWGDYEYATSLALDALRTVRGNAVAACRESALQWMSQRVAPSGSVFSPTLRRRSPFATACALRSLRTFPSRQRNAWVSQCATWLIDNQGEDGAWRPSATLRIPAPSDRYPEGLSGWGLGGAIGDVCLDANAVFTTATVVAGLKLCL